MNWQTTPTVHPELKCSLCEGPLHVFPDREGDDKHGVTIICLNKPCDPKCHENPCGHGENPKEAYEVLKQKYRKFISYESIA